MNNIWNELSEESKRKVRDMYEQIYWNIENSNIDLGRCDVLKELFGEENLNPKPQIKTWEDVEKHYPMYRKLSPFIDLICSNKLYNKLVATYKIYLLIDLGYGGIITDEEWANGSVFKHTIWYDSIERKFCKNSSCREKTLLSFHTVKQRNEFLENNESLCKDYYMIN